MATTTNVDVDAVPTEGRIVAAPAEAAVRASAPPAVLGFLKRAWEARGFFGGFLAIGLGAWAQSILLGTGDGQAAFRLYALAIAILVLSLFHPTLDWVRRVARRRTKDQEPALSAAKGRNMDVEGVSDSPADVVPTTAIALSPTTISSNGLSVEGSPAPLLARRTRATTHQQSAAIGAQSRWQLLVATLRPWSRYTALRERLGWRATVLGLVLTGTLMLASLIILSGDPPNSSTPVGGWLWAAALIALLLTLLGAPAWPRGNGLLPGPSSDFFAKGIPHMPSGLEALLVGAVLLVGLLYRVVELETMPGIFGDEGERGMDARAINEGRPSNIFGYGWWGVPNLYFYLMAPFLRVFGDTMVGARMLSVVAGLITIWFVYKTARLLWGPRAGLIAGALMAVSPVALQFSRLAGESTPTAALWAIGFYFLFMALRYRRWSDWVLSGAAWGFSLYFYAAGKLIIPLAAVVGLYCLIRWQLNFFKRYALGWMLLLFSGLLVFMPYGLRSQKEGWVDFTGRANETSIFSPARQAEAFARYGITHSPPRFDQSLVSQVLSDPGAWSRLIFEQTRVSTEVLYRSGDPTPFLVLRENNGALLNPLWAVLAILGLAYGAWKFWDARFAIASLWFWGGLMGAALTMDTPSVQRLAGAWPALMLFPAALLDRVFAAGWPLSRGLARVWTSLAVVVLIAYFAIDSHRVYFDHYKATCPYCDATTQARYAQALGKDYKAYQLGVGAADSFFSYGSTRFVAKGVEGADLAVPNDYLPITDDGKGAAFIVMSNNADYLPIIRAFYPMGKEESIKSADGVERFKSYKITREQLAQTRTVGGAFTLPDGTLLLRDLRAFGQVDEASIRWALGHGVQFPNRMSWRSGLVAPSYGVYSFEVKGDSGARLEIDGRLVIQGEGKAEVVLAKGLHAIRLSGTIAQGSKIDLQWGSAGAPTAPIPTRFIYNGSTGGLSGEFVPLSTYDMLRAADPLGPTPRFTRRSDAFFGYKAATDALGQTPFIARWQGWLDVPSDGTYGISTTSNGPSVLYLDGEIAVDNPGNPNPPGTSAQLALTKGKHAVDIRYAWLNGRATFELYWIPPNTEGARIIPPTALEPLARSWPRSEIPDAPPVQMPQTQAPSQLEVNAPARVMGGLSNPRGIAVDAEGNAYVGDRGNGRVVVFGRDGNELRSWGKLAPQGAQDPAPGEFVDISDLAVGPDGTVYVMDLGANRLYLYTREGQLKLTIGGDLLGTASPNGIGVSSSGDLYVASTAQSRIVAYPNLAALTDQTKGSIPDSARSITGGEGTSRIEQPLDAAVDPNNPSSLYVADLRDRIALVTATNSIEREWLLFTGREDGGGRLAISPDGKTLYLSDPDRHRVTVVSVEDGVITYFGGPGTDPGLFRSPGGIAVGPDGRVYVLDRGNGRVQVFEVSK